MSQLQKSYNRFVDSIRTLFSSKDEVSQWGLVETYLKKKGSISNQEARELIGVVDTIEMSKMLKKWVEEELLTQIVPKSGAKRNIRYRLRGIKENRKQQELFEGN